jgi:hypothetical protein
MTNHKSYLEKENYHCEIYLRNELFLEEEHINDNSHIKTLEILNYNLFIIAGKESFFNFNLFFICSKHC